MKIEPLGRVVGIALALAAAAAAEPEAAAPPSPGAALYAERCASCHDHPAETKAPGLLAMRQMSSSQVFFSLMNGKMKTQAAGLPPEQLFALTAHVSSLAEPWKPKPETMCSDRDVPLGRPLVARFGMDANATASQDASTTSLDASNIAKLRLKWAFGLPNSAEARSQPVITEHTIFAVASGSGLLALDRETGCIRWYRPQPSLRTSLTLGSVTRGGQERAALFIGDTSATVSAFAAENGEVLWQKSVGLFPTSITTGAPIQHGNRLIVPISQIEVAMARDPNYPCCKAHGGVRALDASTGEILWTTHFAPDAKERPASSAGTPQFGPSGVPVWSTPIVDAKRSLVYVGTGQNGSSPATELSDSIVALDLATGAPRWHYQALPNDAYNDGCAGFQKNANCPAENGPDLDFGASPVLTRDSRGKEFLIAAQKSGHVYALDPDAYGKLVWKTKVGAGSPLGGIHWGVAVGGGAIYAPAADPPFPLPGYQPLPGLHALRVDDGALLWKRDVERGCETDMMAYFGRDVLYPECSFFFGLSAAPTLLPGVVLAPGLDGRVRAFAAKDGTLLWEFATSRAFETVNGVQAHGGSIDSAGAVAAGNMLYVQSGYTLFGELPGNVLLAFEVAP